MLINGFNAVQEALDADTTIEKYILKKAPFLTNLEKSLKMLKKKRFVSSI